MKANILRLQSASFEGVMTARRTLAAIRKECADARRPSMYCTVREVSAHPRVDALTYPWGISQSVNPPAVITGSSKGFSRLTFFTNESRTREALK